MANNIATDDDFITKVREANRKIWNSLLELKGYQQQWGALDYGTTLEQSTEGSNAAILPADVGSVVFATSDAFTAVLNAGHATNMAKLL